MKLTLEKASVIVDKALAKAREARFRPMCVAVLDDGGCVKALKREDGASILRPTIAIGKAELTHAAVAHIHAQARDVGCNGLACLFTIVDDQCDL